MVCRQRYVRNLIDFDNSVLGHPEIFDTMEAQLAAGENVVLLANHQTEADPAVSDNQDKSFKAERNEGEFWSYNGIRQHQGGAAGGEAECCAAGRPPARGRLCGES